MANPSQCHHLASGIFSLPSISILAASMTLPPVSPPCIWHILVAVHLDLGSFADSSASIIILNLLPPKISVLEYIFHSKIYSNEFFNGEWTVEMELHVAGITGCASVDSAFVDIGKNVGGVVGGAVVYFPICDMHNDV
jgi:hypothetical protein